MERTPFTVARNVASGLRRLAGYTHRAIPRHLMKSRGENLEDASTNHLLYTTPDGKRWLITVCEYTPEQEIADAAAYATAKAER